MRPHKILFDKLEQKFFEDIPTYDEGYVLSYQEAGIEIHKL
jgi:hypothetical protein